MTKPICTYPTCYLLREHMENIEKPAADVYEQSEREMIDQIMEGRT